MRTLGLILGAILFTQFAGIAHAQTAYETEYERAIQGAVANIQSNGAVIASPSKTNPDYYYDWVRDTSLTMRAIIELAYDKTTRTNLQADLLNRIDLWIDWELGLQNLNTLTGLGEPRFNVNGTANNQPWGRPQNDAPASRAITAMLVANEWISQGRISEVETKLYKAELPATTLIKRDLEYVAHNWQNQSFDLWEEEKGMHFYTLTVQKVALLKGADLANRMNDGGGATFYAGQAAAIDKYLAQFWDPTTKTIRYAIDVGNKLPQKTTDLDISVLLAAIQTYDGKFYVDTTQLNSTVKALISQFTSAFKVNSEKKNAAGTKLGVALGRYPGDVYSGFDFSGGNPWFLSTLALAEYYCDLDKSSKAESMAQFDRVLYHTNSTGDLSEQFNKGSGIEQGAVDLTWSYTAYITAYRACFSNGTSDRTNPTKQTDKHHKTKRT
jgi:glucoamylase